MHAPYLALLFVILTLGAAPGRSAQALSLQGKDVLDKQTVPLAPEERWQFAITPYFWLPSVDLDLSLPKVDVGRRTLGGDVHARVPWWESVSKISDGSLKTISANGRVEFSKGRWGGFVDGYWIYAKESGGGESSRATVRDRVQLSRTASLTSRSELGQVNFGPRYLLATMPLGRAAEGPSVAFEVYGGGRVNWFKTSLDGTVTLDARSRRFERRREVDLNSDAHRAYVEPMLGLRSTWTLGRDWTALLRGDAGGFGLVADNNWDCDLEAGLAWQFHRHTWLDLGYRARGQWQDLGSRSAVTLSGWFHGPELGLTFKF